METNDSLGRLVAISFCLFIAFICAVVSVATEGWSTNIGVPLLTHYAGDKDNLRKFRFKSKKLLHIHSRYYAETFSKRQGPSLLLNA